LGILLALLGSCYLSLSNLTSSTAWVIHTHEVQESFQRTFVLLVDAETGVRGYMLTKDPEYLGPFSLATRKLPDSLRAMRTLTKDRSNQQGRMGQLDPPRQPGARGRSDRADLQSAR
jgi:CHASE3 domain sensor protein